MPRPTGSIFEFFEHRGWAPHPFQLEAWRHITGGRSGLINVPTGAGKTYAAYLGALEDLLTAEGPGPHAGLRILYVSPLRAVSRDVELAMRAPVNEFRRKLTVESRTGDTTSSLRAKQRERLPNILITTPESLSLLLTDARAPERFARLRTVILDEWHELLSSKRGTQTELALTRLRAFAPAVKTWALSATISNLDVAAQSAVGLGAAPAIVRAPVSRPVEIRSLTPERIEKFPWAGHLGLSMLPRLIDDLDPAVSTLVFTNTRSQAELWHSALLAAKPEWAPFTGLHHGSIDRAARERVESGLKDASVRLVVATSSLDLGVDFAPVERVYQIGSPKGIARLLQRAGRSGHRPGATARVTCVPTNTLELVEIAAVRRAVAHGHIEPRTPLSKPIDVLAQHMVTCALGGGFTPDELFAQARTAYSYRDLTRDEFDRALELVRDGGACLQAYPQFKKLSPAHADGPPAYTVTGRRTAALHRLNVGTICAEATLEVRLISGRRLGSIEENFIARLKPGDRFLFAGRTLVFVGVRELTAVVRLARGRSKDTPHWAGTRLPISESLGRAVRDALGLASDPPDDLPELRAVLPIITTQRQMSHLPAHDELLIETCRTREGSHMFVYPFEGRLVHGGLAAVAALRLTRRLKTTFAFSVNDYGFELITLDDYPYADHLAGLFDERDLTADVLESLNISDLARLQFREISRVAGLVFQSYPGAKKSGRQIQASASLIYDVFKDFDPNNVLLEQARREVLDRQFELSRLTRTLRRLADCRVVHRAVERPTPLGFPLVVERTGAQISGETLVERLRKMRDLWEEGAKPMTPHAEPKPRALKRRWFAGNWLS